MRQNNIYNTALEEPSRPLKTKFLGLEGIVNNSKYCKLQSSVDIATSDSSFVHV